MSQRKDIKDSNANPKSKKLQRGSDSESSSDYISSESSYMPSANNSNESLGSSDESNPISADRPSDAFEWRRHRMPSQEVIDFHKNRTPARSIFSLRLLDQGNMHGSITPQTPQKR